MTIAGNAYFGCIEKTALHSFPLVLELRLVDYATCNMTFQVYFMFAEHFGVLTPQAIKGIGALQVLTFGIALGLV